MARVKAKDTELLDDATLGRVIGLLESDKPITKKEACAMLRISYNTTRLGNIIDQFKARMATEARLRAERRGKAASQMEIMSAIESYLDGESVAEIAKRMYRSSSFIKGIIRRYNVPVRSTSSGYFSPELLPDEILTEEFNEGELVWSARYNFVATVEKLVQKHDTHGNCYRIYVHGKDQCYANQPWYELGRLEHLQQLGVNLHGSGNLLG